jgi:hypothetical protein
LVICGSISFVLVACWIDIRNILGGTSVLDLITIYKIQNATPFSRGHYSGICGLIEN